MKGGKAAAAERAHTMLAKRENLRSYGVTKMQVEGRSKVIN